MKRTRQQRIELMYWNQTDIQEVLGVPYKQAKKIYDRAKEIERKEDGEFQIFDNRVKRNTVLKLVRIKKADIS